MADEKKFKLWSLNDVQPCLLGEKDLVLDMSSFADVVHDLRSKDVHVLSYRWVPKEQIKEDVYVKWQGKYSSEYFDTYDGLLYLCVIKRDMHDMHVVSHIFTPVNVKDHDYILQWIRSRHISVSLPF